MLTYKDIVRDIFKSCDIEVSEDKINIARKSTRGRFAKCFGRTIYVYRRRFNRLSRYSRLKET